MAWHSITSESQLKPANDFETEALKKYGLLVNEVPTRYHSPYFYISGVTDMHQVTMLICGQRC